MLVYTYQIFDLFFSLKFGMNWPEGFKSYRSTANDLRKTQIGICSTLVEHHGIENKKSWKHLQRYLRILPSFYNTASILSYAVIPARKLFRPLVTPVFFHLILISFTQYWQAQNYSFFLLFPSIPRDICKPLCFQSARCSKALLKLIIINASSISTPFPVFACDGGKTIAKRRHQLEFFQQLF